jgi:hypothetical protein
VPKQYEVSIGFLSRSQYGRVAYKKTEQPFKILNFETAVEYLRWQVSLIFWLTEGEDATPRVIIPEHINEFYAES